MIGIKDSLSELDIELEVEEHSSKGPYISLDWLIPTGFVLMVLKPYYETFMQKAAEDHYEKLKSFVNKRLYDKAINPEEEFQIVSSNGAVKETILTMNFSVMHDLYKDGRTMQLKLMFPKKCSSAYFEKAVLTFISFQAELLEQTKSDALFESLLLNDRGRYGVKVLWFNEESQKLEFLDVIESAKSKSIVVQQSVHMLN
jgi:hypothetical protein